jgi:hypothetical protein
MNTIDYVPPVSKITIHKLTIRFLAVNAAYLLEQNSFSKDSTL